LINQIRVSSRVLKSQSSDISSQAKTISIQSNKAGEYSFKPLANGTYTRRVTAAGFNDFEAEAVEVKLGAVNHLDVGLAVN
jgi:hypothetical protein